MVNSFRRVPVSFVAKPILGGTPRRQVLEYWNGNISWASAKDIVASSGRFVIKTEERITSLGVQESAAKILPKGTIVITARGTVGAMAMLGEDMSFNQSCYGLVTNDNTIPDYLYYAIKASMSEVQAVSYGTVFDTITMKSFDSLTIPLPPLAEQRAIASILGSLDDKIELNRRMNATLEAIAQALFKSWFVDFDPVRAKMEGRQPFGMDAETAALFPDRFEESALGEIPRGWRVDSVYSIADVLYGAPYASSLFNSVGDGLPLIRIRDLASHKPDTYTPEAHTRQVIIEAGDIVVGMDGEFRAHQWKGLKSLLNQRMCSFRPKPGVPRSFVRYSIAAPLEFIERSEVGTTVIHLGKSDIDAFRVVVPTPAILSAYQKLAEPMVERTISNSLESLTLTAVRDALLPNLLSGVIRVKQAEQLLETVEAISNPNTGDTT